VKAKKTITEDLLFLSLLETTPLWLIKLLKETQAFGEENS